MAAVTVPWGAVGIVSQEEVVFAVVGVGRPAVSKQMAGRELVQREQHVVDNRVPDGSPLGKGQVVGVAERVVVAVCPFGGLGPLYRRIIVEECVERGVIGVDSSCRFVRPRGARRRSRARCMARLVLHFVWEGSG